MNVNHEVPKTNLWPSKYHIEMKERKETCMFKMLSDSHSF